MTILSQIRPLFVVLLKDGKALPALSTSPIAAKPYFLAGLPEPFVVLARLFVVPALAGPAFLAAVLVGAVLVEAVLGTALLRVALVFSGVGVVLEPPAPALREAGAPRGAEALPPIGDFLTCEALAETVALSVAFDIALLVGRILAAGEVFAAAAFFVGAFFVATFLAGPAFLAA